MKQVNARTWVVVALISAMGVTALLAQEATYLTRAQWLKKIGASVTSSEVLRGTLAQVAPDDRVEFTQRMLKAVTRMPVGPDEKAAAFVRVSVACIAGVNGDTKQKVIAEVFAGTPSEYLPVVTEELAKRFDQTHNGLSDEQFEKIASETLGFAIARNAQTDSPSVRNTFAILAFLRGAKNPALQNKLISQLPDERMRNLAASWVPPALKDRDYSALLAAADVEEVPLRNDTPFRYVGHSNLDRLLADLNANAGWQDPDQTGESVSNAVGTVQIPLSQVRAVPGVEIGRRDHMADFGINRVPQTQPTGYQNQGTSVIPDRR